MSWVLVTGGVCSGIGKGCVAAMLARVCARAGVPVAYQKLEPCLQGEIATLPNTHFGEIVCSPGGASFDGDVARAAFYVPGFQPDEDSDLSLGRLLSGVLERSRGTSAPRFQELDALLRARASAAGLTVIEVGGTAGELEHQVICEALRRALGVPALHVHLTALVSSPSGRRTTKPAQLSLEALALPAQLVLVRGATGGEEELAPLRALAGGGVVVQELAEDGDWPERAVVQVLFLPAVAGLLRRRLGIAPCADPLFERAQNSRHGADVTIIHDGAGAEGYASLVHRLRAWSSGRLKLQWQSSGAVPWSARGIVRVGEHLPLLLQHPPHVPTLEIVPRERGLSPRHFEARPDWWGSADAPTGDVARFVREVLEVSPREAGTVELAYAEPGFAARYLAASQEGALRDHAVLDELVARSLPAGERLSRSRILDVGCGSGRWAARLVAAGAREVVGVEPAPPMAAAARALGLERFRLLQVPIEHYVPEGSFDAVLASMSLDHVEYVAPVLRRLAAHLAPRGRLIITTEHPLRTAPRDGLRWVAEAGGERASRVKAYGEEGWRTFHWFDHPAAVHVYHRMAGTWARLLREAGLELVALHEPVSEAPRDAGNPRFWFLVAERPGARRPLVTVDGGAASGKTSLGEVLARRLEWTLVDTGLLQRAWAWWLLAGERSAPVRVWTEQGRMRCSVGTRDVTEELGSEVVAMACSQVSQHDAAREGLDTMLEELTRGQCIVTGRAMGRLYPDALVRIFLTASMEVRAARRGCSPGEIQQRDRRDAERGRLLEPDIDTLLLDTSDSGPEALAEMALYLIKSRLG